MRAARLESGTSRLYFDINLAKLAEVAPDTASATPSTATAPATTSRSAPSPASAAAATSAALASPFALPFRFPSPSPSPSVPPSPSASTGYVMQRHFYIKLADKVDPHIVSRILESGAEYGVLRASFSASVGNAFLTALSLWLPLLPLIFLLARVVEERTGNKCGAGGGGGGGWGRRQGQGQGLGPGLGARAGAGARGEGRGARAVPKGPLGPYLSTFATASLYHQPVTVYLAATASLEERQASHLHPPMAPLTHPHGSPHPPPLLPSHPPMAPLTRPHGSLTHPHGSPHPPPPDRPGVVPVMPHAGKRRPATRRPCTPHLRTWQVGGAPRPRGGKGGGKGGGAMQLSGWPASHTPTPAPQHPKPTTLRPDCPT